MESFTELITRLPVNDGLFGGLVALVWLACGLLWWAGRGRPALIQAAQFMTLAVLVAGAALVHPLLGLLTGAGVYLTMTDAGRRGGLSLPQSVFTAFAALPDWFWLAALALMLRLPRLFDPLWYDETFTAYVARLPYGQVGNAMLQGDVHPPLWSSLEWLAKFAVGQSEAALRLPALAFGVLAVLLSYRLVLALGLGRRAALLTGLLVAVLPAHLYFSSEARAYTLLTCLALGMVIAVLEDRPPLFILCGALSGWTHNLGYIYLGVLALAALFYHRQPRWLLAVGLAGATGALWLPFLPLQLRDISHGYWIQPLVLPKVFRPVIDVTLGEKLPTNALLSICVPALLLTLMAFYHSHVWLRSRRGWVWLALTVGVPVVIALVSVLWRPVYLSRTLLPCVTALIVAWGYALLVSRFARALAVVALCSALWVFYGTTRPSLKGEFAACAGADAVYFLNTPVQIAADYYLDVRPQVLWAGAHNYADGLSPQAVQGLGFPQGELHDLTGDVCVVYQESVLTAAHERREHERLLAQYGAALRPVAGGVLVIYRIHLPQREAPHTFLSERGSSASRRPSPT